MVWSENFHFKPFPDSRVKRDRDRTQIMPRTQITVRLRLQIAPRSHAFDFTEITPQDCTPSTSSRWHQDGSDRTKIAIEKWLGFDEFDRIWWIFFLLGFVSVFIWEMILYIYLEVEEMWENVMNKKKMCFLYYFQQHHQTLKNIFQNIFWNATKYLKIFFFFKNNISEKYLFFEKYFTWNLFMHCLFFLKKN